MKARSFVKKSILGILTILLLAAGIVFVFDPFMQYHKPWVKFAYSNRYERNINPGLAKHYEYESISTGSSMTRNFLISDLEKIMPKPIKLSIAGSTAHEINNIINYALAHNKNVKTILIGFDLFALNGDKNQINNDANLEYLFSDGIVDKYQYLFNLDNLKNISHNIRRAFRSKYKKLFDYEHMYEEPWQYENSYASADEVYEQWLSKKKSKAKTYSPNAYKFSNFEQAKNSFEYNYISLAKENPNIKFIIYYPPYSVLMYKDWEYSGQMDEVVEAKKYFMQEFAKYPNVELYDFQMDKDMTTNLSFYQDPQHFHQEINIDILKAIKTKNQKYLVTQADYDKKLANFKKYVGKYKTKFD